MQYLGVLQNNKHSQLCSTPIFFFLIFVFAIIITSVTANVIDSFLFHWFPQYEVTMTQKTVPRDFKKFNIMGTLSKAKVTFVLYILNMKVKFCVIFMIIGENRRGG